VTTLGVLLIRNESYLASKDLMMSRTNFKQDVHHLKELASMTAK